MDRCQSETHMPPSIKDRSQTDSVTTNDTDCSTLLALTVTLTFIRDLALQFWLARVMALYECKKITVKGLLVQK